MANEERCEWSDLPIAQCAHCKFGEDELEEFLDYDVL